jgi:predicted DNA-binding transcriptional regulator YafY
MDRTDRILLITDLLRQQPMTIDELADALHERDCHVSRRTLERDRKYLVNANRAKFCLCLSGSVAMATSADANS